jgi:hypothetical protein
MMREKVRVIQLDFPLFVLRKHRRPLAPVSQFCRRPLSSRLNVFFLSYLHAAPVNATDSEEVIDDEVPGT